MELWIRSQDKWTLTTAKSVYVRFPDENRASIFNQDNINIGQYSWDRALEVLNKIHQRLINLQTIEIAGVNYITSQMKKNGIDCVYEMPKE